MVPIKITSLWKKVRYLLLLYSIISFYLDNNDRPPYDNRRGRGGKFRGGNNQRNDYNGEGNDDRTRKPYNNGYKRDDYNSNFRGKNPRYGNSNYDNHDNDSKPSYTKNNYDDSGKRPPYNKSRFEDKEKDKFNNYRNYKDRDYNNFNNENQNNPHLKEDSNLKMPVFIGKISQERVNNDAPIVDTKPANTEKPFVDVRLYIFIILIF